MRIQPHILNVNDLDWTYSRAGIKFVTYQGAESMTATLALLTPGHKPGPHTHAYEQLVFILQGECDFYVDSVAYQLTAGSMMAVPPNVEHYIVAKGDKDVINLDVFYPKRPDKPDSVSDSVGAEIYSKRDYRIESKVAEKPEDRANFEIFRVR